MVDGLASFSVVASLIFSIPLGISGPPSLTVGASVHPHSGEESMALSDNRKLVVEMDLLADINIPLAKGDDNVRRAVAQPGSNLF